MMRWPLILFSLFVMVFPARAGQDDVRLEPLFQSLVLAEDRQQGLEIETRIWTLWLNAEDPAIDAEMTRGVGFMNSGYLRRALASFDKIIALDPEFAEAWNKRATVYYMMGDMKRSVLDIERTVALEPRHFGAFSGLGLIYMAIGDDPAALRAFERVLEIHPHFGGIANQVEKLKLKIKGRAT